MTSRRIHAHPLTIENIEAVAAALPATPLTIENIEVAAALPATPLTFEQLYATAAGRHAAATPAAPPRLPIAYVMIDGEFTGASYRDHAAVAFGFIIYTKHKYTVAGSRQLPWGMHMVRASEQAAMVVRMRPPAGTTMCPATFANFWKVPANAALCKWVQQGAVSQEDGMARVHAFLTRHAARFDLRFVSKPAGMDIARFRYCMETYGPAGGYIPHHNSICAMTYAHVAAQLMVPYGPRAFSTLLNEQRTMSGIPPHVSHFPLEDCRAQICDFMTCENIVLRAAHERAVMASSSRHPPL